MAHKALFVGMLLIGILLLGYGFASMTGLVAVAPGEQVFIPEYASIWCGECESGAILNQEVFKTEDGGTSKIETITCPYVLPATSFIPRGCQLTIRQESIDQLGEFIYYLCDEDVDQATVKTEIEEELSLFGEGDDVAQCKRVEKGGFGSGSDITTTETVQMNEYLMVGSEVDASIVTFEQSFCLKSIQSGKFETKSSCSRDTLIEAAEDVPDQFPPILIPGEENAVENVVIGYQGTVNSVDIVEDGTGNSVWLTRTLSGIEACQIKADSDGTKYVDVNDCRVDEQFVCRSSELGAACIDGKEVVRIEEGAECSDSLIGSSQQVGNQLCEITCVNGQQRLGECVDIIAPVDVTIGDEDKEEGEPLDPTIVAVLIFLAGLAAVGGVLYLRSKGKI